MPHRSTMTGAPAHLGPNDEKVEGAGVMMGTSAGQAPGEVVSNFRTFAKNMDTIER